jgi:hypothetical protein
MLNADDMARLEALLQNYRLEKDYDFKEGYSDRLEFTVRVLMAAERGERKD